MFSTKKRLTKNQKLLLVLRAIFEYPFVDKTSEFNNAKLYENLKHYVYHRLLVEDAKLILSDWSKPKSNDKISEETNGIKTENKE